MFYSQKHKENRPFWSIKVLKQKSKHIHTSEEIVATPSKAFWSPEAMLLLRFTMAQTLLRKSWT